MAKSISNEDRDFCWMYGRYFREFYPDVPWDSGTSQLQDGWFNVRGRSTVTWAEAEPHVRAGWEAESRDQACAPARAIGRREF